MDKNKKPIRIVSGFVVLVVACFLAMYAQRGVDMGGEPSILGFIVMWVVGIASAIILERCARYLIDQ